MLYHRLILLHALYLLIANKPHVIISWKKKKLKYYLQYGLLHYSTINLFLKSLFLTSLELPNPQENFLIVLIFIFF